MSKGGFYNSYCDIAIHSQSTDLENLLDLDIGPFLAVILPFLESGVACSRPVLRVRVHEILTRSLSWLMSLAHGHALYDIHRLALYNY